MTQKQPLGVYIRKRRRALDMTQKELSERLKGMGVDRSPFAISNWETGRQVVPLDLLPAIAQALEEPSAFHLYDLLGVIDNLPGSQIVRALGNADINKLDRINKYIEMVLKDQL